jgi:hypothetical protein
MSVFELPKTVTFGFFIAVPSHTAFPGIVAEIYGTGPP